MSGLIELIEFLRDRLDEDQERAETELVATSFDRRDLPQRALADVAARRQLIERTEHAASALSAGVINPASVATLGAWQDALRILATVWEGHPDYDPLWRPVRIVQQEETLLPRGLFANPAAWQRGAEGRAAHEAEEGG